jgi:hypothetical protein
MAIDTTKKIKQVTYNGTEIPLRGYDTSDATVTADDMASGVVAYGKDGKVTGSTAVIRSGANFDPGNFSATVSKLSGTYLRMSDTNKMGKRIIDTGAVVRLMTSFSNFGNATAADVAKGKTFTSKAGLKVTGTAEGSSAADVTFELYNNDFDDLTVVYMAKGTITEVTIPLSDHKGITTPEGSIVALIDRFFKGDTVDLVPTSGSITQGWRDANITLFVAGAETNGMNIDVNRT